MAVYDVQEELSIFINYVIFLFTDNTWMPIKDLDRQWDRFNYRSCNEVYHSSQLWWQQLDGEFKPPLLGGELKPTLSDIAAMNYKSALKKKGLIKVKFGQNLFHYMTITPVIL